MEWSTGVCTGPAETEAEYLLSYQPVLKNIHQIGSLPLPSNKNRR